MDVVADNGSRLHMGCKSANSTPVIEPPGPSMKGVRRRPWISLTLIGSTRPVRPKNPTTISDGWALGWDRLQWILYRSEMYARGDSLSTPSVRLRGVRFVMSTKVILLRCIREKGCVPDAAGQAFLDTLPNRFRDFISLQEVVP